MAELLEFLCLPSFVVAHKFGCLRKLITIKASSQTLIAGAADGSRLVAPRHEDADCGLRIGSRAAYLPAQCILISHRSPTSRIDVVFARATTHNGLDGRSLHRALGILGIPQLVPGFQDGRVLCSNLRLYPVEIGLRVQPSGVNETSVGVDGRGLCASRHTDEQQREGKKFCFHMYCFRKDKVPQQLQLRP